MPTRAEIEAYIRQAATARGLDPNFAVRVAKGESGLNPQARLNTAREDSKGIWQLNTKNGLGVEALKRGIDPGNPETWQAQTDFALDQAKKSWRPWTVARNLQAGRSTPAGASAATARDPATNVPPRRPDGAPGPRDAPSVPVAPQQGMLSSIYEPFEKLAAERKEQQAEQQLAAAQALMADRPPVAPPPPPAAPAAPPVDFAALMFPRIRRGLLGGDSYGLLS